MSATATVTAFQAPIATAARGVRTVRTGKQFSFKDLVDVLAKSLLMAQSLPDTGRPSARQLQAVRKLVETI